MINKGELSSSLFFILDYYFIFTSGEGFDYFSDRDFSAIVSIDGFRIFRPKVSYHVYWPLCVCDRNFIL